MSDEVMPWWAAGAADLAGGRYVPILCESGTHVAATPWSEEALNDFFGGEDQVPDQVEFERVAELYKAQHA